MLPAISKEVRLTCTVDWHFDDNRAPYIYHLGFDEAAGTVFHYDEWNKINEKIFSKPGSSYYNIYFIRESSFGYTAYNEEKADETVKISRMDGTYSRSDYPKVTGLCVPSEMPKRLF